MGTASGMQLMQSCASDAEQVEAKIKSLEAALEMARGALDTCVVVHNDQGGYMDFDVHKVERSLAALREMGNTLDNGKAAG
jgi:hypothetical protein